MFGLEYWLSCSSIAPCQNFARMDDWTGCDKGFILGVRTKCACRPVRVRVLLVRYHIAKRKTLVLVVGVEGSLLFALVVALPFTFPCAFVLTDRAAPTPLAPGSPCIVLANDFCLSLVIRLVNNSRTNLEVAHLQRLIKIDGLYFSKRSKHIRAQ